MTRRSPLASVLGLSAPLFASNAKLLALPLVDLYVAGAIGERTQVAAGYTLTAWTLIMVFFGGMTNALTPLVAQAEGERDRRRCFALLRASRALSARMTWPLAVVGVACLVVAAAGPGGELVTDIGWQLGPRLLAAPLFLVTLSGQKFLIGMRRTWRSVVVFGAGGVVHTCVAFALIAADVRGELAAAGLGLAFVAEQIATQIAMRAACRGLDTAGDLRGPLDRALTRRLMRDGTMMGTALLVINLSSGLLVILVAAAGAAAVAAHAVLVQLGLLLQRMFEVLGTSGGTWLGRHLGARDLTAGRDVARATLVVAVSGAIVAALALGVLRAPLADGFAASPAVADALFAALPVAAISLVPRALAAVALGLLYGASDVRAPSLLAGATSWLVLVPAAALPIVLGHASLPAIWWAIALHAAVLAIALAARLPRAAAGVAFAARVARAAPAAPAAPAATGAR